MFPIHIVEMQHLPSVRSPEASHLVTPASDSMILSALHPLLLLNPNTATKHASSTKFIPMLFLIQLNTLLIILLERLGRQIPEDLKNSVANRETR